MFLVQPATQIRFPGPFPSLVGPGGTPQLSWLSPEIPIFVGGTGTWKRLVGKGCIWASISRADSPWGPCLAASVWPISWMKSWTSPASSQPSWDLHTHTYTHTHTHVRTRTHTHASAPAGSRLAHILVPLVRGSEALTGTHVCSCGQMEV